MASQPDSTITVRLVGSPAATKDLRLDDFIEEMQTIRTALRETERVVSGSDPSLYFRIKKLQKSSPAVIVLEAASETDDPAQRKFASAVVRSFGTNLQLIRRRRVPDNIDVPALESYRELAIPVEKHQLEVQIKVGRNTVVINQKFREMLESVIGTDEHSYGSVSGTIEAINLHTKNQFWLYPIVGASRIVGKFRSRDRKKFTAALDKYVSVYGRLRYKTWDKFPYSIFADDIQVHDVDAAPTLNNLKGVAPDATGELSSQEYIDRVRDEW
jgi:hypothetical protein